MAQDTISQMLQNHQADSWRDLSDGTDYVFDDPKVGKLERLESYVDYCFETYPIVSNTLDRDQIQCCLADWGHRRGQERPNTRMKKQEFGKRVPSKYRTHEHGTYAIFLATALVGVPPEEDKGLGWKPCVRHELGHAIDDEKRGYSNHDSHFKKIMAQFGEERNDGQSSHGYPPRVHR